MIKTEYNIPSNYYSRSRDFQLIGRILDCVFNSSKGYSDMVQYDTICSNTDIRLLDLISKAVGFEVKRKYNVNDLFVLCSTFKSIMRRKGTLAAIEQCVRVLLKAQNINKSFYVIDVDSYIDVKDKKYIIEILVPEELEDIALLEDMLDYVMPAGYIYSIIRITASFANGIETGVAGLQDIINTYVYQNSQLGHIYGVSSGESQADSITDDVRTELTVVYAPDDEE